MSELVFRVLAPRRLFLRYSLTGNFSFSGFQRQGGILCGYIFFLETVSNSHLHLTRTNIVKLVSVVTSQQPGHVQLLVAGARGGAWRMRRTAAAGGGCHWDNLHLQIGDRTICRYMPLNIFLYFFLFVRMALKTEYSTAAFRMQRRHVGFTPSRPVGTVFWIKSHQTHNPNKSNRTPFTANCAYF